MEKTTLGESHGDFARLLSVGQALQRHLETEHGRQFCPTCLQGQREGFYGDEDDEGMRMRMLVDAGGCVLTMVALIAMEALGLLPPDRISSFDQLHLFEI